MAALRRLPTFSGSSVNREVGPITVMSAARSFLTKVLLHNVHKAIQISRCGGGWSRALFRIVFPAPNGSLPAVLPRGSAGFGSPVLGARVRRRILSGTSITSIKPPPYYVARVIVVFLDDIDDQQLDRVSPDILTRMPFVHGFHNESPGL